MSRSGHGANASANVLYYGDNLDVLRNKVADDSVDLIYLDPRFMKFGKARTGQSRRAL